MRHILNGINWMGAVAAQARTGVAAYGAVAQQRQRSQRWCMARDGNEQMFVSRAAATSHVPQPVIRLIVCLLHSCSCASCETADSVNCSTL